MVDADSARSCGGVSSGVRLTDRISLGVLAEVVSRDVVEDVLTETGRREKRSRLLPAHVVVRFCMGMCLFVDDDYEEVMRKLVGSLRSMASWGDDWHVPSTSAITQARQRLGPDVLRVLFERVAVPVVGRGTRGAWLGLRRLMAIDGFSLDVADTPENVVAFGKRHTGPKVSAFPQLTVVGLGECGSHALVGASIAGCYGREQLMARELVPSVESDMLVMADRGFYGFAVWGEFCETGADLLWRASVNIELPFLGWLPDGSYRSMVINPKVRAGRRRQLIDRARQGEDIDPADGRLVRIVEYQVPDRDGSGAGEIICLMTTVLDPLEATALELAAAYHERWEFEGLIDEIKTHQRGPARVLRSKSPDMVRQEIWAMLLTHYGVRRLMCAAADEIDVDPDRLSFMRSLRVIRRQVTAQADFSP